MDAPERLGKNLGSYFGETIDIQKVLREIDQVLVDKHWTRESIPLANPPVEFIGCRRGPETAAQRIYISTGIHGDEPAGPLAVLQLLSEDQWPADAALWLCPCLNPTGFPLNRRENALGIDLNRDYRHFQSEEVRAHVDWLQRQPNFDLCLCLHEDWESHGFYVYELNLAQRPSVAEQIIAAVSKVCPIDRSHIIETWPASNGIIQRTAIPSDRPQWPEALYLSANKTQLSCTLEAPSDFPLGIRVSALVAGVRAAIGGLPT